MVSWIETHDEHILEDFTDALFCDLWEKLKSGTHFTISVKDHLQMLLEGLGSLRTILREQPKNFDEEMRDLSGIVICDAGVVICSLFLDATKDGLAKEKGLLLFDLLERIKLIRAKVCPKFGETSTFNFPKTNELGFVDFLLENLKELTNCEMGPIPLGRSKIQTIHEELLFLRSFLGKIGKLRNEQEELQALWSRVIEMAYQVEFLIDSLVVGDITDSSPMSFDSIIEEIKIMKSEALKIFDSKSLDVKLNKATKRLNHMPLQRSTPKIEDVVVGLDDEAKSIMDRLTRGSNQLQIVAIVGMPGLGKTTLSKIVYNDDSIESHFHTRAWCCVSQVYHKKNLLLEILTCIFTKLAVKYFEMTGEDLALELYRSLKGKRYLIVLDDVWDIEAWKSLEAAFPNDANGSRILLTSRHRDAAPRDQEPHFLRQLTEDESWKLLKAKLFPREDWPSKFHEIGLQIVEKCKRLPLTIVILAGILETTNQESWNEVVGSLSSRIVSSTEQCKKILELSYNHLPDELKPCLLYFGAFPEDQEIPAKKLTWLWLAEGFVRKSQSKSLEDEAKDYLMHLICRSLVMVAKQSSTGEVKTCRIHDLLHEFCVEKSKEENFSQLLQGYDELSTFNEPNNLRRLFIHISKQEDFQRSRLVCPRVRCLLLFDRSGWYGCDLSFVFCIFKLVKVLDLSQSHMGYVFPNEIQFLVQLRYLAVRLGGMNSIPSWIANLSNLETFIVVSYAANSLFPDIISLPDTIWSLKKLRHVEMKSDLRLGFCFPMDSVDKSGERRNLVTFSVAILSRENMEMILRKFTNIRKLNLRLDGFEDCAEESNKILVLNFLSRLESLHISPFKGQLYQMDFCFPLNLRKLNLEGFSLSWCNISTIGNLPNLEVLKLFAGSFYGESWHMEAAGEFPKLSFLKLSSLKLKRWTASESEDQFPCLRKLVIEYCFMLREVPSCLGYISTLETIEVSNCSESTARSVKQVHKEQIDLGNMDLKVLIHPPIFPDFG